MTPEDLNNALQGAALTFVREVKQQDVPLRVNRELAVDIIRTKKYQHRDEVSLILEARAYIKGRLPVRDRATAVAILLQRDAVLIESRERGHHESGTVWVGHLLPRAACCAVCAKSDFIGKHFIVDKAEAELNRMYALDDARPAAP
jgi:hypothetical protein